MNAPGKGILTAIGLLSLLLPTEAQVNTTTSPFTTAGANVGVFPNTSTILTPTATTPPSTVTSLPPTVTTPVATAATPTAVGPAAIGFTSSATALSPITPALEPTASTLLPTGATLGPNGTVQTVNGIPISPILTGVATTTQTGSNLTISTTSNSGSSLSTASGNPFPNTENLLVIPNNGFPGTNFLAVAAADSLLEIAIGQIAQTNSGSAVIGQLGQTLASDHTSALQLARQLAPQIGVTLRGLNSTEQTTVRRFSALNGDAFDRAFLAYLIQTHQQDIGRFQVAAVRASSQNVRSFAATNLPILLQHLLDLLQVRETFLNTP